MMAVVAGGNGAYDPAVTYDRFVVEEERFGVAEPELHEAAPQARLLLAEYRVAADEIAFSGPYRKAQACFQHMVFVGDVMTEMPVRLLDAAGIQRMQTAEFETEILAGFLNRL